MKYYDVNKIRTAKEACKVIILQRGAGKTYFWHKRYMQEANKGKAL